MPFGIEKLEWFGYPTVKNFEDMFIRFDRIHERDGRIHTQTDTTWQLRPRLMPSIVRQKTEQICQCHQLRAVWTVKYSERVIAKAGDLSIWSDFKSAQLDARVSPEQCTSCTQRQHKARINGNNNDNADHASSNNLRRHYGVITDRRWPVQLTKAEQLYTAKPCSWWTTRGAINQDGDGQIT